MSLTLGLVIGIDDDNDDQPLDNLDFDTPGTSGTFQPPTPLEKPPLSADSNKKIERASTKQRETKEETKQIISPPSIPHLAPPSTPPPLDPTRPDLPQMPKLVPCPSPRRPPLAQKSPSRKRKSSPAASELPVNNSTLQSPALQPPKLTTGKTIVIASSTNSQQPQKPPTPGTGQSHI